MQDIISCIEELDERVRMEMEQDAISPMEVPVAPHGAEFLRKRAELERIEALPWSSKRAGLESVMSSVSSRCLRHTVSAASESGTDSGIIGGA